MVEGINSTEGTDSFGNYVDYGSFQEVSIGSGASSAESPVPGVYTVLVSKSGGNRYTGSFYGDYESKDWQSYNIDEAQIASGVTGGGGLEPHDVNRLNSYRDLNADIGGFMKRDALWWYASVRSLDSSVRYTNFPVKPHETHLGNFTSKLTYQLSQNNKLIGYYQPSTKVQKNRLDRQLLGCHGGDSPDRGRQLPAGLQPAALESRMELAWCLPRRSSSSARASSATGGPTRRTEPASATRT